MGTGYLRADVSNQIANGQVIDADVFDLEFDAIADAFHAATGHTHDGTTSEGAPITTLGPSQDVTITAEAIIPAANDTVSLGTDALRFKDLFLEGDVDVDGALNVQGTSTFGTITGNVSFTGSVVVPDSLISTHAINVATADARYISVASGVPGNLNVAGNLSAGGTLSATGAATLGTVSAKSVALSEAKTSDNRTTTYTFDNNFNGSGSAADFQQTIRMVDTGNTAAGFFVGYQWGIDQSSNSVGFYAQNYRFFDQKKNPVGEILISNGAAVYNTLFSIPTKANADAAYQAASSSLRYKDDARTHRHAATIEALGDLRRWEWGGELPDDDHLRGREGWGLIAEDVVKVLPEAAVYDTQGNLTGLQALPLIALLIQEIKDLKQRLDK